MSRLQSFRPNPKKPRSGGHTAQTLVEFSLTLLVFLLTLIMIIEIARILQAFITVQHAARMAGRYAVTGRFNDYYNDLDSANTFDTDFEDNGNIDVSTGGGPGWDANSDIPVQRILPCRPIMHTTQDGLADPLVGSFAFGSPWTEGMSWDHRLENMYNAQATFVSAYPYYQPFRNARTCSIEEVAVRAMAGLNMDPDAPGRTNPDTNQLYGGFYDIQVRSQPNDSSPQDSSDMFDRSDGVGGNAETDVNLSRFYGDPSFAGSQGGICLLDTGTWSFISGASVSDATTLCDDAAAADPAASSGEYYDTNDSLVSGYGGAPSQPVIIQIEYNLPIITPILSEVAPAVRVEGVAVMINEPFGNTGLQQQAQLPPEIPVNNAPGEAPTLPLAEIVPEITCYDGNDIRIGYFNRGSVSVENDGTRVFSASSETALSALPQFDNGRNPNVLEVTLGSSDPTFTWNIQIDDEEDGTNEWDDTLTVTWNATNSFTATLASGGTQNDPPSTTTLTLQDCATIDSFGVSTEGPADNIFVQDGQPVLIRPGAGTGMPSVNNLGAFEWTEVTDAEWYYVWMGYYGSPGYSGGGPLIEEGNDWVQVGVDVTCSGGTCTGVPSIALVEGREYAWFVRAYTTGDPGWQDASGLGPWSFPYRFQLASAPLQAAEPRSPINLIQVAQTTPTFQFIQKDNVTDNVVRLVSRNSGVVYNDIFESDDICSSSAPSTDGNGNTVSLASDEVFCQVTPNFTVTLERGEYIWWVRTSNPVTPDGIWTTDAEEFELITPATPVAPTLVSPVSPTVLTTDTAARPDFVFNAVPGADSYDFVLNTDASAATADPMDYIYVANYDESTICVGATCTIPYPFANVLANDIYVWNVRGVNSEGAGDYSNDGVFEVNVLPPGSPIGTTNLIFPIGDIEVTDANSNGPSKERPAFRWSKYTPAGAEASPTSYQIFVRDAVAGNSDTEFDVTIPVSSPELVDGGTYWEYIPNADLDISNGNTFEWFIRPINGVGPGNWEGPGTFSVESDVGCNFVDQTWDFETAGDLTDWVYNESNPFNFSGGRSGQGNAGKTSPLNGNGAGNPDTAIGLNVGNDANNTQAGYVLTFNPGQTINAQITFDYLMQDAAGFDNGEFNEVLLAVNNQLYGTNGNDYIEQQEGGASPTTWRTVSVSIGTLSATNNQIILGGYNNQSTTGAENTNFYFDNITISENCIVWTGQDTSDFEGGNTNGFSFVANPFNFAGGRTAGDAADANELGGVSGNTGSGIGLTLGPSGSNMQGGFSKTFQLTSTRDMQISFDYRIEMPTNYESNEYSEILVALVNGGSSLFGENGNPDYIYRLDGSGNSGDLDTGWLSVTVDLGTLTADTYTVIIGGYNNQSTESLEITSIYFDNVVIDEAP